jgi:hypothetical protein
MGWGFSGPARGAASRPARAAVVVALICLSAGSGALVAGETARIEPEIDLFASMAGKCDTVNVAGRDFACSSVAFFHSPNGRSSFTVPLNDPNDQSHIISFSGENASRTDDVFELAIDRMLLNSRDRPRVDGLPVPAAVSSRGTCRQVGKLSERQVSSVSCVATDVNGAKYEFRFESDGSPARVMSIQVSDVAEEAQRAKVRAIRLEQLKCRQTAFAQGVLPRDRTAFILHCMDQSLNLSANR